MEIFRPLIGFVLGMAVTIGAYVGGFLDSIPHWSRSHAHWSGGTANNNNDPDHVRYKVSADFQSDDGNADNESCPPRFEFHNRTNRNVVFSSDGYDDLYRGSPKNSSKSSSSQDTVSMTPDQDNYGPPAKGDSKGTYASQDYGSQNYGSQDYSSTDYGGSDSGGSDGSSYGNQNASYGQNYGGGGQYASYDDEYPGPSGGGCSGGVVEIFLDRKN